MSVENIRIKNSSYLVDAFNVDPIYLRHTNEGKVPDYRVGTFPSFDSRSAKLYTIMDIIRNCCLFVLLTLT